MVRASKERDACVGAEASLRPIVLLRDIRLVEKHRCNISRRYYTPGGCLHI